MKKIMYPPTLQWEITPRCNHNCVHCYNYWRKSDEILSDPEINYLDIAKKIAEHKPVHVIITGGEPLYCFDKIKSSIEFLRRENIYVSINTNATLITDEMATFFHDNKISLFISLPSSDPEICDKITTVKGSFDRISHSLELLNQFHVNYSTNMVVSKINYHSIYDTALFVKNVLKKDVFNASKASKPINSDNSFDNLMLSKEELSSMYKTLYDIGDKLNMKVTLTSSVPACTFSNYDFLDRLGGKMCSAGKTTYGIDSLGNVKACPRDSELYGNILEDDFYEIWDRMIDWRNDTYLPTECKGCRLSNLCNGGCRLDDYPKTLKKDVLASDACLDNVDKINFNKQVDFPYQDDYKFKIPNFLQFVDESFGVRVNNGAKFLYITSTLADFLKKNEYISLNDISDLNELATPIIGKSVLKQLLKNNIIFD